jgi:hypothetical protein
VELLSTQANVSYTCDGQGWPYMGGGYGTTTAWVVFAQKQDLVDRHIYQDHALLLSMAEFAYKKLQNTCHALVLPATDVVISFRVTDNQNIGHETDVLSMDGKSWQIVNDWIADWVVKQDAQDARDEVQRQQQAAAAQAAADQQQMLKQEADNDRSVFEGFSNPERLSMAQLTANPFAYQGKVIGVVAMFIQMLSSDEALFTPVRDGIFGAAGGPLVLHGVPSTQFTLPNGYVALAFTVTGTETVQGVSAAAGTFIGSVACRKDDSPGQCTWFAN